MVTPRTVVFDLDDTLYPEVSYVKSGFHWVARLVQLHCGVDQDQAFSFLWNSFRSGIRGNSFNLLCQQFPPIAEAFTVDDLVTAYRSHIPTISLAPGMRRLLKDLNSRGTQLAVITDGPAICQKLKFTALGLQNVIQLPIFTDDWGRPFWKPHKRAFEYCMTALGGPPSTFTYVADNPAKDFITPNTLGWQTIRLRGSFQLHKKTDPPTQTHAPKQEATNIADLSKQLQTQ